MALTPNPYKVVVLDPAHMMARRVFVFSGDVPKTVESAIHKGNSSVLQAHFGPSYKSKLGMDIRDPTTAYIDSIKLTKNQDEVLGSSETYETNCTISEQYNETQILQIARTKEWVEMETFKIEGAWKSTEKEIKGGGGQHYFVYSVGPRYEIIARCNVPVNTNHTTMVKIFTPSELFSSRSDRFNSQFTTDDTITGGAHKSLEELDLASELNDIESLLKETPAAPKSNVRTNKQINVNFEPGITYVTDIHLYPEDKFTEVKDKIYLATDIPVYRQHIFYTGAERIHLVYRVSTDGVFTVDIRQPQAKTIMGIPIDKYLYDNRHNCKIESYETFKILGEETIKDNVIYVVDLGMYLKPIATQLRELLNDSYQFELFYYGFILKFWPQLTPDCFRDYIIDEHELTHKYPDLARSYNILNGIYRAEGSIVDTKNRQLGRSLHYAQNNVSLAITQMTAVVSAPRVMLNIRNIFDKLRVTRCIPEIHAYLETNGKKYLTRKRHVRSASDIIFPSIALMKTGLIIACSLRKQDQESFHLKETHSTMENEQSRYLFLNIQPNGKYYVRTIWNEEDEYTFDDIMKIMKQMTDPIITAINTMSKYAFISGQSLPLMTKANTNYAGMNICVFWKKVMLESTFKLIKTQLEPYNRARITGQRNVQQFDKYEFMFRKGMHEYDTTAVERIIGASNQIQLSNYYAYLSNNAIKQKWDQNYDGRIVRMSHRTTDIRFEVSDIRQQEFNIFYTYICDFIFRMSTDAKIKSSMSSHRDYTDVKKLRKLREQDPELYNLKKYGSKKVYSIICQNQRQPLIYTADEIRGMSTAEVKKLTQYWNFTLQKPAFYGCPNKEYPHLSFMVGVHPKNYCLPCCNKKSQDDEEETRKQIVHSICKREHVYVESADAELSKHIMAYGKAIENGRLSKIPTQMKSLFFNTLIDDSAKQTPLDYYLLGVPQYVAGADNVGILFSIALAMKTTVQDIVKSCIADLRAMTAGSGNVLFNTLLNGTLINHWSNMESLIETLSDIFLRGKMFSQQLLKFTHWPELFTELLHIQRHICCFTFIDDSAETSEIKGMSLSLHVSPMLRAEIMYIMRGMETGQTINIAPTYIILCKKGNQCCPVVGLALDDYFRNLGIKNRSYTIDHPVIKLLFNMVKFSTSAHVMHRSVDLSLLKSYADARKKPISRKYVNRQNLCYAIEWDLENDKRCYFPCDYSTHIADGIPITWEAASRSNLCTWEELSLVIEDVNKYIGELEDSTARLTTIYQPIQISEWVELHPTEKHGLIIGAKSYGPEHNHTKMDGSLDISGQLFFYFKPMEFSDRPTSLVETKIVKFNHDPLVVNVDILTRKEAAIDNRRRKLGEALYSNYLYQLFLIEFVFYLESERNTVLRNQIQELIRETNFKKDIKELKVKLRAIIPNQSDYNLLQSQIQQYYYNGNKADLIGSMENTIYDFDKKTAMRLAAISPSGSNFKGSIHSDSSENTQSAHDRLQSAIIDLAKSFCVEKIIDTTDIEFPNIYMPCELMIGENSDVDKSGIGAQSKSYCAGKQLIVPDLKQMADLLATDLMDPLKKLYILNGVWMDTVINIFKFAKYPTEIITIYRMD